MQQKRVFLIGVAACAAVSLTFSGCASSGGARVKTNTDVTKTVAKMLAVTASAPLLFKDTAATKSLAKSIGETSSLKFAVILDRDLKQVSECFLIPSQPESGEIVNSIQKRVRSGSVEFSFNQNGLTVSVVPIREADQLLGYAAVGAM